MGDKKDSPESPQLVNRRAHRESTFVMGRTIGEKREKLETKSERAAARKKDKKRQIRRILLTVIALATLAAILAAITTLFLKDNKPLPPEQPTASIYEPRDPTIEIIDEASVAGGESKITSRMRLFIGQLEQDLIELGYQPAKAIIPQSAIREVDLYLDGQPGYFKTHIDRTSAVTAEDIDRMIRYMSGQGITEYEYVDVRISGKAYWK